MEYARFMSMAGLSADAVSENIPMREITSFRIGGPARLLVRPESAGELLRALRAARALDLPYIVIGNGTNLLAADEGIDGLVISILGGGLAFIEQENTVLRVGAGTLLSTLARESVERGLSGLEWAAGIPGAVGGAAAMNAGAYGGELKQVLRRVEYIDVERSELVSAEPSPEDMGYRSSSYGAPGRIVTSVDVELERDDGGARERMREYSRMRTSKQPLSLPSAGSVFKRPIGHFAGALIESAGLKGAFVGGAMVSKLHAGFIVNTGGATCEDVLSLIALIQKRVFDNSGVTLERELKLVCSTKEGKPCIC